MMDEKNVIPLPIPGSDPEAPENKASLSHIDLRNEFVAHSDGKIKYVDKWGQWLIWNGFVWIRDESLYVQWKVGAFLSNVSRRIQNNRYANIMSEISSSIPKSIKDILKKKARAESRNGLSTYGHISTIMAVQKLTKDHRDVASLTDDWDKDPWLLNTPGGAIDLRTGTSRPPDRCDLVTKTTAVSPTIAEPILWLRFLRRIMNDDADVVSYLQKVFGYFLVGDTKEHEMYFGHGGGQNGKGRTLYALMGIMKDYAEITPIETFTVSHNDRHPTELASLRGARLVTCGENNKEQQWAEAKIKELTGGDPVKARFMRQDEFTYTPQFKLFLTGNNKPRLSHVDTAIERRFRMIPFTVQIPKAERDYNLDAKLQIEWPAILHWMIEGCLRWQAEGLDPPATIQKATDGYLEKEDLPRTWFDDCCSLNIDIFTYAEDLFQSWKGWCTYNGYNIGTKNMFLDMLESRQAIMRITRLRRSRGWGFLGIELLKQPKGDE